MITIRGVPSASTAIGPRQQELTEGNAQLLRERSRAWLWFPQGVPRDGDPLLFENPADRIGARLQPPTTAGWQATGYESGLSVEV